MTVQQPARAIILAAGRGRRLGALTRNRPKCLLPMGAETMLQRQLRILASTGVHDVAVVIGWQGHQVEERYSSRVTIRRNPDFRTTGSVHSLQVAADLLEGDVIILNSDLVFTGEMLDHTRLADEPCVLTLRTEGHHTTNTGTLLSGSTVLDIGKHILPSPSTTRFSGAARVRGDATKLFRDTVLRCDPGITSVGWSIAFSTMIREGHRVSGSPYEGPLFDVNSVSAYTAARAYVAAEGAPAATGR